MAWFNSPLSISYKARKSSEVVGKTIISPIITTPLAEFLSQGNLPELAVNAVMAMTRRQ
jgi:hypothetical protein